MSRDMLPLVANIVSSHASGNFITSQKLTEVIKSVYAALNGLANGFTIPPTGSSGSIVRSSGVEPGATIKKSVFPGYIVCLEDGKQMKMLKRHLKTSYNMTPSEYRERWGLPGDYPMTAPNYAKRRSEIAREIGLGRKPRVFATRPDVKEGTGGKKTDRVKR
jgi:predicted transcriptional regulator